MRMKKIGAICIVTLMVLLMAIGCSSEGTKPANNDSSQEANSQSKESNLETDDAQTKIEFKDLLGNEIVMDKPAERVFISMYFESLFAVGGPDILDRVASMSLGEWSDFFRSSYLAYTEKVPKLKEVHDTGSIYGNTFSMESLLQSNPDIVIVAPFQYKTLGENVKKLESLGIPVVVIDYTSQTLEKHIESTMILGKILGEEERATKLAEEYKAAIEDVKRRVASIKDRKTVYVELGNKGANEIGNSYGNYMWGNIIETAGGLNIAKDKVETYGPLSPEYILSSNPDVIFFSGVQMTNDSDERIKLGFNIKPEETYSRIQPYLKRNGWDKIAAVKDNEVYAMDHGGLRNLYDFVYYQYIGKMLYPEAFEDVDPVANHKEYYKKYLPLEAEGTFMTRMGE